jgi:hypothetical protein
MAVAHRRVVAHWLAALALCGGLGAGPARAEDAVPLAVADFDYADSSGEPTNQAEAHAARLQRFEQDIRDAVSASGKYRVVALECPQPPCSAGAMDAASLTDAAKMSGARLLLYGGIHKMSTLIQFGKAQVVDLETGKLVFDRTISFRGDNDEAWDRASGFLTGELLSANLSTTP